MISSEEILLKYWKHNTFKPKQKEIIENVLKGNDTIALLPTGGGKSICYQVPAMQKEGVCIVISPLIALMHDQVRNLEQKNIKAIAITSSLSFNDTIRAFDNLQFGNYKFVYLSPEKLQTPLLQEKLKQLSINLIAIDEAHCISTWGHDFRPSYLQLKILKSIFPKTPIIAVTATATKYVLNDIKTVLKLNNPKIFYTSFFRKNIAYHVLYTNDTKIKLTQLLKKHTLKPCIIFVNTQKKAQQINFFLKNQNLLCSYYHGGLSTKEKEIAYNNWLIEKTPIMVATNAFGMGIDKNNVSIVIHLHVPNSIENYVQESGRVGRNNTASNALILINEATIFEAKESLLKNLPKIPFIKTIYKNLNQYFQIAKGSLNETIFNFNLHHFCNHYKLPIIKTHNAIKMLNNEKILLYKESANSKSTLRFKLENKALITYSQTHIKQQKTIQLLLRCYGGIIENRTVINETSLASKLKIRKENLQKKLELLHRDNIVSYNPAKKMSQITFIVPREDDFTINTIKRNIENYNTRKITKVYDMINYIENSTICRSKQLLTYFDETLNTDCGSCDVCLKKTTNKNFSTKELVIKIKTILKQHKELSSKEIIEILNTSEKNTLFALQLMLEKNIIRLNLRHKYSLH